MMPHRYGDFTDNQISSTIEKLRKEIFFLLLCVDENTREQYGHINVDKAYSGLLHKLGGMNDVLLSPPPLVTVISLLQEAWNEYHRDTFEFSVYRKLVLDAGAEILRLKGGD